MTERWILETCPACSTPFGQGHANNCPGGRMRYDRIAVIRAPEVEVEAVEASKQEGSP